MEESLLEGIREGYSNLYEYGSGSNKKIRPIHWRIGEDISNQLGDEYTVMSLTVDAGKEYKYEGFLNDKNVDITCLKNNTPISGIGVKFITKNYKQNTYNYFESMLGETANLKLNGFLYSQVLIFLEDIPYFKDGEIIRYERVDDKNLNKYKNLFEKKYHNNSINIITPTSFFIGFIRIINNDIFKLITDLDDLKCEFSDEMRSFVCKHNNYEKFINNFVDITKNHNN